MQLLKLQGLFRHNFLRHQLILPLIRGDPEVTSTEIRETTGAEAVADFRRARTVLVITVVNRDIGLVNVQYHRLQVRHRHPHQQAELRQ